MREIQVQREQDKLPKKLWTGQLTETSLTFYSGPLAVFRRNVSVPICVAQDGIINTAWLVRPLCRTATAPAIYLFALTAMKTYREMKYIWCVLDRAAL